MAAAFCRLKAVKCWKLCLLVPVFVLLTVVLKLRYERLLTVESVLNAVLLLSERSLNVDVEELEDMCRRRPSEKGQRLAEIELKTGPSLSLWEGLDREGLSVVRGQLFKGADRQRTSATVGSAYHPSLDGVERILMKRLVMAFDGATRRHNVTYFLYGGTLIGSYRHHGMIPWDDDVDVAVYVGHKGRLRTALARLPAAFRTVQTEDRWKLVLSGRSAIRRDLGWSFPFVDISFFEFLPSGVVADADRAWAWRGFRYRVCDVFPLVRRPFWDMWLPVPRRTEAVLRATYDVTDCASMTYSHALERYVTTSFKVDCDRLRRFYPFVERQTINETTEVERLIFNNTVLHSITVLT